MHARAQAGTWTDTDACAPPSAAIDEDRGHLLVLAVRSQRVLYTAIQDAQRVQERTNHESHNSGDSKNEVRWQGYGQVHQGCQGAYRPEVSVGCRGHLDAYAVLTSLLSFFCSTSRSTMQGSTP